MEARLPVVWLVARLLVVWLASVLGRSCFSCGGGGGGDGCERRAKSIASLLHMVVILCGGSTPSQTKQWSGLALFAFCLVAVVEKRKRQTSDFGARTRSSGHRAFCGSLATGGRTGVWGGQVREEGSHIHTLTHTHRYSIGRGRGARKLGGLFV